MKLVLIEWLDAQSMADGGWQRRKDVEKLTPALVRSVGWIFDETKDYVTLIAHDGDGEVSGDFSIPKACIKKRRVIHMKSFS